VAMWPPFTALIALIDWLEENKNRAAQGLPPPQLPSKHSAELLRRRLSRGKMHGLLRLVVEHDLPTGLRRHFPHL
jgi:hypothetical protein